MAAAVAVVPEGPSADGSDGGHSDEDDADRPGQEELRMADETRAGFEELPVGVVVPPEGLHDVRVLWQMR
ncbi:hypothetical protein [Dactylosporangium sp. NPDC050588]|uniref:hypothetical protein n=1 Tax=Dactylosporangium sp. NPDC050588 TaxID=3157211 RepID=UPI0033DECAF3